MPRVTRTPAVVRRRRTSATTTGAVVALALSLAVAGCAGGEPGSSPTPTPSERAASASPSPTASDDATALPDASALPTTEPPAPETAQAQEAPPAWHACVTAIGTQYPDLPFLSDVWAYESDDVQDTDMGAVAVVKMGHLDDGRPATEWNCQISGTPDAPVIDSVSPTDV